jgi:hypothetical protein
MDARSCKPSDGSEGFCSKGRLFGYDFDVPLNGFEFIFFLALSIYKSAWPSNESANTSIRQSTVLKGGFLTSSNSSKGAGFCGNRRAVIPRNSFLDTEQLLKVVVLLESGGYSLSGLSTARK